MRFFFPHFVGGMAALVFLVLRLVVGAAFFFHGAHKFGQGAFSWMGPDAEMAGWIQFSVALVEIAGGIMLGIGLLTPLATVSLGCVMAGAVFMHATNGDAFVKNIFVNPTGQSYELAAVYLAVCLLFLIAGPGKLSCDYFMFGLKRVDAK